MKVKVKIVCLIVLFLLCSAELWHVFSDTKGVYHVGIGDILSIRVLGHKDFDADVVVNPDGTINYYFIDSLDVEGKTLKDIEKDIISRLSGRYLRYPTVMVRLKNSVSQRFYVYGEVNSPGMFKLTPGITVLKAIAMAGGYSPYANTKRVKVLRLKKFGSGYDEINVNLDRIIEDSGNNADILLQNEDIVVVLEK